MITTLIKQSPLGGLYPNYSVRTVEVNGWQMAEDFGHAEKEKTALASASALVDWSHIGKVSVRGADAARRVADLYPQAEFIKPLKAFYDDFVAVLRLTSDEFILLTAPAREDNLLEKLQGAESSVVDISGASGCLVLAGPGRDEVMERSSAMNLSRDRMGAGSVVQTTIHTVHTTLWRTETLDIILVGRDYAEFLFDALLDVGRGVGLVPAGLSTLAVSFTTGQ